jgi:hypothetical protein
MGNNYDDAGKRDLESREYADQNVPQEEKPTSLGKAKMFEDMGSDEPALLPGYMEIYSENFPSKGLFYGSNTRFFIRAAQVKEIRHFSTIDETNPFSIDEALNEIVKSCLMIRQPSKQMSFKDLKEEDRIYIIMEIRELTFSKGENQLVIKNICEECNHENDIHIKNSSFKANEISDKIMKYYDQEQRLFSVDTKSNGTIKISPPTIGMMMEITKYIQKKQQEGRKIDQSFVKVLPYMVSDWRGFTEASINNLEVEFMSWDTTKYQTMYMLTDLCKVGVKEKLHTTCEKCHTGLQTPISFPGGIKSLFVVSDLTGELL